MAPVGTFVPFDDPVRFFARIHSATLECPYCGRLFLIGPHKPDDQHFNKVTSMITCPGRMVDGDRLGGCGRKFLIGVVAWPLARLGRGSPRPQRPPDTIPAPHQLAAIRAYAAGRFPNRARRYGEKVNHVEPLVDEDGFDQPPIERAEPPEPPPTDHFPEE